MRGEQWISSILTRLSTQRTHNALIDKLRKSALDEWTMRWIENWLNGRSQKVTVRFRGWSISLMRNGWGTWTCLVLRRDCWEGTSKMSASIWREDVKRMGSSQWYQAMTRGNGQKHAQEAPPGYEEEFLYCADDWSLELAALWGSGISFPQGIQEISEHNPK